MLVNKKVREQVMLLLPEVGGATCFLLKLIQCEFGSYPPVQLA